MNLVIVGIALVFAAVVVGRYLDGRRHRWLRALNLPGIWRRIDADERLEFLGAYSTGTYTRRMGEQVESGTWRVDGTDLVMEPAGGDARHYSMVSYGPGRVGLNDGAGERRFERARNVVMLSPRQRQGE